MGDETRRSEVRVIVNPPTVQDRGIHVQQILESGGVASSDDVFRNPVSTSTNPVRNPRDGQVGGG